MKCVKNLVPDPDAVNLVPDIIQTMFSASSITITDPFPHCLEHSGAVCSRYTIGYFSSSSMPANCLFEEGGDRRLFIPTSWGMTNLWCDVTY